MMEKNHPKYDANITPARAIIENRGVIGRGHSRMPGRARGEFESLSQWGTVKGRLVSWRAATNFHGEVPMLKKYSPGQAKIGNTSVVRHKLCTVVWARHVTVAHIPPISIYICFTATNERKMVNVEAGGNEGQAAQGMKMRSLPVRVARANWDFVTKY
jgi:hypothetical protein